MAQDSFRHFDVDGVEQDADESATKGLPTPPAVAEHRTDFPIRQVVQIQPESVWPGEYPAVGTFCRRCASRIFRNGSITGTARKLSPQAEPTRPAEQRFTITEGL